MITDASPKYTNSDLNYKIENPISLKRFIHKARNISDYSHTKIAFRTGFTSFTECTHMTKQSKAAPEKLKRAMFKASSRGIAIALQKK